MYDSNRWHGFELRRGDVIISTPPKCGTTWTQMICALLILQEAELPLSLDTLSPWIDMVTRARTDVFADLEAQTLLLPKTSSMLVGADVRVGPMLYAIAVGGALVRRGNAVAW